MRLVGVFLTDAGAFLAGVAAFLLGVRFTGVRLAAEAGAAFFAAAAAAGFLALGAGLAGANASVALEMYAPMVNGRLLLLLLSLSLLLRRVREAEVLRQGGGCDGDLYTVGQA